MSLKPLDSAMAAEAAFEKVKNLAFPPDLFSAKKLKWATIGTGVIAHQMAESMALAGRHLYAVQNRTQAKAEAFAKRYGIEKVYETLDELLADPELDAIYITTPHNTHINYLIPALLAGKHVLCEKSITLNSKELKEARAAAKDGGAILMDATTILHMPLYKELRRRYLAGDFGRMNIANINFGSYKDYGDMTNRFYNINLAGGAMLDIGVYALTIMRLFMDKTPCELSSFVNLAKTGVDESSVLLAKNDVGQLGCVSLSLHSKQPKRSVISFDKCYLEVDSYPRADTAKLVWTEDGSEEIVAVGQEGYALCYEVADLERAVAGDAEAAGLIDVAQDVMDMMTNFRQSWGVVYPEERTC